MSPPLTKPGTRTPSERRLSDVARKVVAPEGIVSTGWPAVRDICVTKFGLGFDPWQDGAGRLILGKRSDGKLAAMIGGVGMSLPRQVGKTYLISAIIFALCILRPGLLVIWSAHHSKTHNETFLALQAFCERTKVRPYIKRVYTGSGDEEIRFVNGSRILFGARERGFGRGIPGVDVIVDDEAQIMSDKALDAQLATMNTSDFGLAIFVGTPPRPDDPSEAFTRMRTEAWDGTLRDAVWIELGADANANPGDRKQWAKANPSYPHRTPAESMLRLKRKLKPDSFLREGLGVWDEVPDEGADRKISDDLWNTLAVGKGSQIVSSVAFAADVSPDRRRSSISVCGLTADGRLQVEVVADGEGTTWVGSMLTDLAARWSPLAIVLDKVSSGSLGTALVDEGIEPVLTSAAEMTQACAGLSDDAQAGILAHLNDPALTSALRNAETRELEGGWAWKRRKVSITPLVSATLARYGFVTNYRPPKVPAAAPVRETNATSRPSPVNDPMTMQF